MLVFLVAVFFNKKPSVKITKKKEDLSQLRVIMIAAAFQNKHFSNNILHFHRKFVFFDVKKKQSLTYLIIYLCYGYQKLRLYRLNE